MSVTVYGDGLDENDETILLNLSNPSGLVLGANGVGTIIDDDTLPPVLTISSRSATEGNSGTTDATFTLTLSYAPTSDVTANWYTSNSSATAGSDYAAASGTLTFAPGETTKTVTVTVYGDTAPETNETFWLSATASGATIGGSGAGTIVGDDARSRASRSATRASLKVIPATRTRYSPSPCPSRTPKRFPSPTARRPAERRPREPTTTPRAERSPSRRAKPPRHSPFSFVAIWSTRPTRRSRSLSSTGQRRTRRLLGVRDDRR